jgi:hypothetical protein
MVPVVNVLEITTTSIEKKGNTIGELTELFWSPPGVENVVWKLLLFHHARHS